MGCLPLPIRGGEVATPMLSVVIPVYDEAANLVPLYEEVTDALLGLGAPFEILFVDDGSSDASPQVLDDLAAKEDSIKVIRFRRGSAHGFAEERGRFGRYGGGRRRRWQQMLGQRGSQYGRTIRRGGRALPLLQCLVSGAAHRHVQAEPAADGIEPASHDAPGAPLRTIGLALDLEHGQLPAAGKLRTHKVADDARGAIQCGIAA